MGFCGLEFTVQGFWGLGPGFIYIYTHVFTYLSMPWKGGGVWGLRFGVEGDHPVSWQVGFGAGGKQNPFIILKALQYCPGSERPKASCFTRPETLSHIATPHPSTACSEFTSLAVWGSRFLSHSTPWSLPHDTYRKTLKCRLNTKLKTAKVGA